MKTVSTIAKNVKKRVLDMKAKIGKYPSRLISNIYDTYLEKRYGLDRVISDKPKLQTRADRAVELLEEYLQTAYNVINWVYFDRQKQKVNVRIDPWDTWGMDSTLQPIILPMLKQLQSTKHGAPFVDVEDVPEYLRPTAEETANLKDGETDVMFFERWDWVMNEMIFAFESIDSHWEDQFTSGNIDLLSVPIDYAGNEVDKEDADLFRMDRGPNDTFEMDRDGMTAYQNRISNGFRLFGKYFTSLWD
jgi:hypothetical protein